MGKILSALINGWEGRWLMLDAGYWILDAGYWKPDMIFLIDAEFNGLKNKSENKIDNISFELKGLSDLKNQYQLANI